MTQTSTQIMRGTAHLALGQVGVQLIRFVRNFVLVYLLTPEEFGIASTFALVLLSLEFLSDLSLEKLIVRDPKGDTPEMMAAITLLSMARFFILALAIFLGAGWIAAIFDVPQAADAYRLFALVPIIRGFIHLDMFRVQREMNFTLEVYANVASQIVGLVVAGLWAWATGHFIAVVWGAIAQTIALVIFTHLMAKRPFRMAWHPDYARNALIFGWPLMVNGLVLMLVSTADRVLVGAALGMVDLAVYTIAVLFVTVAGSSLIRIASSVALPWMSAAQEDAALFQARHSQLGHAIGVVAVFFFVPITLLGADVVAIIFGDDYKGPLLLVGLIACAMAVKFMRSLFVTSFLANGQTKDLMLSETARVVGIVLAVVLLYVFDGGLIEVAFATCLGDLVAYVFCLMRMASGKQPVATPAGVYLPALAALALALLALYLLPDALLLRFAIASLMVGGYIMWRVMRVPELLDAAHDILGRLRGKTTT